MSQDSGSSMLEMDPGVDGPAWAEQVLCLEGKKQHGDAKQSKPAPLDIQRIYKLTLSLLEREGELGAARSDISGMLRESSGILTLRTLMLTDSLPKREKEGLERLALRALENCGGIEIPPLSAFIKATLLPKQSSAAVKRICAAMTILLLSTPTAPQTTTINTTPLSNEVLSVIVRRSSPRHSSPQTLITPYLFSDIHHLRHSSPPT